jgi:hypothetical protein
MSSIAAATDRVKGQIQNAVMQLRVRVFGTNNERIDFLMDSFYKLNPNQRTGAMAGVIGFVLICVLGLLGLYFSQVGQLNSSLSNTFSAMHELRSLRTAYEIEDKKFDKLYDLISRRTRGLRMKPEFEKIARNLGVTIDSVTEKKIPLASDNPLSDKVQEVHVDLRLGNISVPRLLNFLVDIEKSNKYLRVIDLKIGARYGTRLFFDANVKIRGYSVLR